MSDMDEELDRLNDLLNQIPVEREGMTIVEFDGYVAALIVCPEMILPAEWLPPVWGGDGAFEDIAKAEDIIGAVMDHYNRVAQALAEDPEAYAPVLQVDPNGDDVVWTPWVDGFERAMRLRASAWEKIVLSDDEEAAASINLILAMNGFTQGRSELSEEAIAELKQRAPVLIPEFVRNLNAWTKSRWAEGRGPGGSVPGTEFRADDAPNFGRKVGRNDPCPCGSGRKYKHCCAN